MAELDCSGALQPCACTANQVCVQIGRSSTECAKNTCVDRAAAGGGGGSSVGAVAGQAVGGVVGGLLVICAAYWFWRRRRRNNAAMLNNAASSPKTLKEFKMGQHPPTSAAGGLSAREKQIHDNYHNSIGSPGPGEEDAKPVKRQSLRFDPSNNGTSGPKRRSVTAIGEVLSPSGSDNPFGDHHSSERDRTSANNGDSSVGHEAARQSQATVSEFSFRSSHSTNIIPIAYIPAHASQSSTIDMTKMRSSYAPSSGTGAGDTESRASRAGPRGSRASVPLSLRDSAAYDSSIMNGSAGTRPGFGNLFDRRSSSAGPNGESNGLEIIAGSPASPPAISTPTHTKDGRPIRPPRAPGLDLKLPTPDAISPPVSPSFPWNRAHSPNGGNVGGSANSPHLSPPVLASNGLAIAPHTANARSQRETLLSPASFKNSKDARASAYSTFSQATGSTNSHMSYILEAPQVSRVAF